MNRELIVQTKPVTLVMPQSPNELLSPDDGRESAAVPMIAGVLECDDRIELLCPRVYRPEESDYVLRTSTRCVLRADAVIEHILGPLGNEAGVVHVHNHPGGFADFSAIDDAGLPEKLVAIRTRKPEAWFVRAVLGVDGIRCEAFAPNSFEPVPINEIRAITRDRGIATIRPINAAALTDQPRVDAEMHSRTIALLGGDAQVLDALARVRVGVVGLGGTGSVLASQLPFLNVHHMALVDDDLLERTNLNRWVLAQPSDEGRAKVSVGAERLLQRHPHLKIRTVQARFPSPEAEEVLKGCDLIFSCPDNDWTRYEIAQFAARYMKCCITLGSGVALDATGKLRALGSQMRVFIPGAGGRCEACQGLDLTRLSPPDLERQRRVTGYAVSRSVVTINSTIASLTAGWLLHWFRGQWSEAPTYLQYDELALSVNDVSRVFPPNAECLTCGRSTLSLLGRGDVSKPDGLLASPVEPEAAYGGVK
jgi:molybdopterin/thiamine biosynthesis adenylyltransferase